MTEHRNLRKSIKPRGPKEIVAELATLHIGKTHFISSLMAEAEMLQESINIPSEMQLMMEHYGTNNREKLLALPQQLEGFVKVQQKLHSMSEISPGILAQDDREVLSQAHVAIGLVQDSAYSEAIVFFVGDSPENIETANIKTHFTGIPAKIHIENMRQEHLHDRPVMLAEAKQYERVKGLVTELCQSLNIPIRDAKGQE